ncbi:putative calreticulin/calnexin, P domain superfamily [Helianthus debilis subsp. tardiflorus]
MRLKICLEFLRLSTFSRLHGCGKPDIWDEHEDGIWKPPKIAYPAYKGTSLVWQMIH